MGMYKPPARWTAPFLPRLRFAGALALAAAIAAGTLPASAAGSPIRVLVWAPVAEAARETMSQALWTKYVDAYVGGNVLPHAGPSEPTLADCRKAGADYAVVAPFELRPHLPGMQNASGRIAARTHVVVTNCITGTTSLDQPIALVSDTPSNASDGDFESAPEITWAHGVPAALAKVPLVFERVARIFSLSAPLALVDMKLGSVRVGDGLRDFAYADHRMRATPILMTVTQVFEKYLEVLFPSNGDRPSLGDLVEPLPKSAQPQAVASPPATR